MIKSLFKSKIIFNVFSSYSQLFFNNNTASLVLAIGCSKKKEKPNKYGPRRWDYLSNKKSISDVNSLVSPQQSVSFLQYSYQSVQFISNKKKKEKKNRIKLSFLIRQHSPPRIVPKMKLTLTKTSNKEKHYKTTNTNSEMFRWSPNFVTSNNIY